MVLTSKFANNRLQGSPSTFTPTDRESFRRGSSVTTWRAGKDGRPYLYTLNLACPEERWAELGGLYHKAADSFRLTPPTKVIDLATLGCVDVLATTDHCADSL